MLIRRKCIDGITYELRLEDADTRPRYRLYVEDEIQEGWQAYISGGRWTLYTKRNRKEFKGKEQFFAYVAQELHG